MSRDAGIFEQRSENDILKYLLSFDDLKSWLREICVEYLGYFGNLSVGFEVKSP